MSLSTYSMEVVRTSELKPGLWVPVEWSSHLHDEALSLQSVPGYHKDGDVIYVATVLEADPVLDPAIFRVIRKRLAIPDAAKPGAR